MVNELSQRVDNISFYTLKDNPFLSDGSGELNIVDEAGNIIAKIDADGKFVEEYSDGIFRQQIQYLFNVMLRLTKHQC